LNIKWVRGTHNIQYKRPDVWFILGKRGGGKSSLLEHIGTKYLEEGACICDLFGSRDGEGLAWLRSPYAKEKNILLVTGDSVEVEAPFETKNASCLTIKDFDEYDIVISASPFHRTVDQEFINAAKITDLLYSRLAAQRLVYLVCREAANFYYSRLKVCESQTFAKANMIYLLRESRHVWLALGLDSIRYYAIDIDIRSLSDFMILKSQGLLGLPDDLKWLYSLVEPHLIRKLDPSQLILLVNDGSVGYGTFPEIQWHKQEQEHLLNSLGIKIHYGEILEEGISKGTYKTVGDTEHSQMVKLYAEGLGYVKIATQLKRSSRTISLQVEKHNQAVNNSKQCPSCKRVGSELFNQVVRKGLES
jgi:hypothetical protein